MGSLRTLVVLSLLALAGCVASAEDDADITEEAFSAGSGEACGGPAHVRCADGLVCKTKSSSPDAEGTCVTGGATCLALPACLLGHEKIPDASACPNDGSACYERTLCGRTIWCTGPGDPPPDVDLGAGPGEHCGGISGKPCRKGLACDTSEGLSYGVCR